MVRSLGRFGFLALIALVGCTKKGPAGADASADAAPALTASAAPVDAGAPVETVATPPPLRSNTKHHRFDGPVEFRFFGICLCWKCSNTPTTLNLNEDRRRVCQQGCKIIGIYVEPVL